MKLLPEPLNPVQLHLLLTPMGPAGVGQEMVNKPRALIPGAYSRDPKNPNNASMMDQLAQDDPTSLGTACIWGSHIWSEHGTPISERFCPARFYMMW